MTNVRKLALGLLIALGGVSHAANPPTRVGIGAQFIPTSPEPFTCVPGSGPEGLWINSGDDTMYYTDKNCVAHAVGGGGGGGTNYQTIQDAGTPLPVEPILNFVSGVTCVDNPGSTRTDCTVTGATGPWQEVGTTVSLFNFATDRVVIGTSTAVGDERLRVHGSIRFEGVASTNPGSSTGSFIDMFTGAGYDSAGGNNAGGGGGMRVLLNDGGNGDPGFSKAAGPGGSYQWFSGVGGGNDAAGGGNGGVWVTVLGDASNMANGGYTQWTNGAGGLAISGVGPGGNGGGELHVTGDGGGGVAGQAGGSAGDYIITLGVAGTDAGSGTGTDGTFRVNGQSFLSGNVHVTGKLTVDGPIDPPSVTLSSGSNTDVFFQAGDGQNVPAPCPANVGQIRYNNLTKAWEQCVDGALTWTPLSGGGGGGMIVGNPVVGAAQYEVLYTDAVGNLAVTPNFYYDGSTLTLTHASVNITTDSGFSGNPITIRTGDGSIGAGGNITAILGDANGATGNGGRYSYTAGNANGGSGDGGGFVYTAGAATGSGNGGGGIFTGGDASTTGRGGSWTFNGGASANASQFGGGFYVKGGGTSITGGKGGPIELIAGDSTGLGGAVSIAGGYSANPGGAGGPVTIAAGLTNFGTGGDVKIDASVGTVANGTLKLNTVFNVTTEIGGQTIFDSSAMSINSVPYVWTNTQGSAGTFLRNDGLGGLTWASPGSGIAAGTAVTGCPGVNEVLYVDAAGNLGCDVNHQWNSVSKLLTINGTQFLSNGAGKMVIDALVGDSLAIGHNATVLSSNGAVALGEGSSATGNGSLSIGNGSFDAGFSDATSIGPGATSGGDNAVAIGTNATNGGPDALAIGNGSQSVSVPGYTVAIGSSAHALGDSSVAIGKLTQANGTTQLVAGQGAGADASSAGATVLGDSAIGQTISDGTVVGSHAKGNAALYLTVVGGHADGESDGATIFGYQSINDAASTYTTALGPGITVTGSASGAVAIGRSSGLTSSTSAVVIGNSATITGGVSSVAIGDGATSTNLANVSIGHLAHAGGSASVVMGDGSTDNNTGDVVAIGNTALGSAAGAVAVGSGAQAASQSVVIGQSAKDNGSSTDVIIGQSAQGGGSAGVAVGVSSHVEDTFGIAIGSSSHVASGGSESIAIGDGATVSGSSSVAVGQGSTGSHTRSVLVGVNTKDNNNVGVAIGPFSELKADFQFVAGSDNSQIHDIYFGSGVASASPGDWTLHGTEALTGTLNQAGGNGFINGGVSTGFADGGGIAIGHAFAGGSGSTQNPPTQIALFDDHIVLGENSGTTGISLVAKNNGNVSIDGVNNLIFTNGSRRIQGTTGGTLSIWGSSSATGILDLFGAAGSGFGSELKINGTTGLTTSVGDFLSTPVLSPGGTFTVSQQTLILGDIGGTDTIDVVGRGSSTINIGMPTNGTMTITPGAGGTLAVGQNSGTSATTMYDTVTVPNGIMAPFMNTHISSAIVNTVTESTLVDPSGQGAFAYVANFFQPSVGPGYHKTIHIHAAGILSTTGTPTVDIRVKQTGGSPHTIADSGAFVLPDATLVGTPWEFDMDLTGLSSTTVTGHGFFRYSSTAGTQRAIPVSTGGSAVTINAGGRPLDLTFEWGTASPSNSLTVTNLIYTAVD